MPRKFASVPLKIIENEKLENIFNYSCGIGCACTGCLYR